MATIARETDVAIETVKMAFPVVQREEKTPFAAFLGWKRNHAMDAVETRERGTPNSRDA
ncbi:hypothetical protein LTR39_006008, partial [Cryomyces antarcticus]